MLCDHGWTWAGDQLPPSTEAPKTNGHGLYIGHHIGDLDCFAHPARYNPPLQGAKPAKQAVTRLRGDNTFVCDSGPHIRTPMWAMPCQARQARLGTIYTSRGPETGCHVLSTPSHSLPSTRSLPIPSRTSPTSPLGLFDVERPPVGGSDFTSKRTSLQGQSLDLFRSQALSAASIIQTVACPALSSSSLFFSRRQQRHVVASRHALLSRRNQKRAYQQ